MKNAILIKSIFAISICLFVGFLTSLVIQKSILNWYETIKKPFFTPPNWVFATIWTILYLLMGLAFAIIWTKKNKSSKLEEKIKTASILFGIQLVLNAFWSILFFVLSNSFLALIEILILWLVLYETIKAFKKIDSLATNLLYPYLAWVSFAAFLNGSIWFLNS